MFRVCIGSMYQDKISNMSSILPAFIALQGEVLLGVFEGILLIGVCGLGVYGRRFN